VCTGILVHEAQRRGIPQPNTQVHASRRNKTCTIMRKFDPGYLASVRARVGHKAFECRSVEYGDAPGSGPGRHPVVIKSNASDSIRPSEVVSSGDEKTERGHVPCSEVAITRARHQP